MSNISHFFPEQTPSLKNPLVTFSSKQNSIKILEHVVPNKIIKTLDLIEDPVLPSAPAGNGPLFSPKISPPTVFCALGPLRRYLGEERVRRKGNFYVVSAVVTYIVGTSFIIAVTILRSGIPSLEAKAHLLI